MAAAHALSISPSAYRSPSSEPSLAQTCPRVRCDPVTLYHLVAIDEDTALRGRGAAPAPGMY